MSNSIIPVNDSHINIHTYIHIYIYTHTFKINDIIIIKTFRVVFKKQDKQVHLKFQKMKCKDCKWCVVLAITHL